MTHQKDDMDTASKPDAAPAGGAEALRLQVRQADERGDEAMRRAHAAESAVEAQRERADRGFRLYSELADALGSDCMDSHAGRLDRARRARAALAAAPVVPPDSFVGASPCGGPGSAASRPEPQSVSALRAPIPGAERDGC